MKAFARMIERIDMNHRTREELDVFRQRLMNGDGQLVGVGYGRRGIRCKIDFSVQSVTYPSRSHF